MAPAALEDGGEVAEARVALRSVPGRRPTRASLQQAVDAVVRAFDGADEVRRSGRADRPTIEATFSGTGCAEWAAGAVHHASDEVRRAGSFAPAGSVAEGIEAIADSGARVRVGDPTGLAHALCIRAAPGQILLAGDGWSTRRGIDALRATGTGDAAAVSIWVLREVR